MSALSHSAFLQALGWATIDSLWQAGFLWCIYLLANYFFRFSAEIKYRWSVVSTALSFFLFAGSFFLHLGNETDYVFKLFQWLVMDTERWLTVFLTSASVTYLALLTIPAYKLFVTWRHTQIVKKQGLLKAPVEFRLFVQKIAVQLAIKKKVQIFLSKIVKSPVTIGFLKPVILLPVASLNSLSLQQAEAILLHELSHIKRYDYLMNIFINVVQTLLYFNPFVKLFARLAGEQREECCDELVLQFGYDKISYASALFHLQKTADQTAIFAIGAAGKKYLLRRIQNIVGIERQKPKLRFTHFAGFAAALLFIVAIHSLIVVKNISPDSTFAQQSFLNPFYVISDEDKAEKEFTINANKISSPLIPVLSKTAGSKKKEEKELLPAPVLARDLAFENKEESNYIQPVAFVEAEAHLNNEEQKLVKATINATKKVLATREWKEMEESIADAMTEEEKEKAKREYLNEIKGINWNTIENNLKAKFDKVDWFSINQYLATEVKAYELDSLQQIYAGTLSTLKKNQLSKHKNQTSILPFPDLSRQQIECKKLEIQKCIDSIRVIKTRKIVKL